MPRRGCVAFKANLQAFFIVNQGLIIVGYWVAGPLTVEVMRLPAVYFAPAVIEVVAGMALFTRVDPVRFRRIVVGG